MCSCHRHWVYRMCLCSDKRVYRVGPYSSGFGVVEQKPSHHLSVCWPSGDNTENDWFHTHFKRNVSWFTGLIFSPKPVQRKLPFYRLDFIDMTNHSADCKHNVEQITPNHTLHPNLNLWHWLQGGIGSELVWGGEKPPWFINIVKNSHFQNFLQ